MPIPRDGHRRQGYQPPANHLLNISAEEDRCFLLRCYRKPDPAVARTLFDQSRTQTATRAIRPATKNLVEAVMLDVWPRNAAIVDFGLRSQEHYEALYHPLRHGDITPEQVDGALGNGRKLTELVNAAPHNPHKGIEFRTDWDDLLPEPGHQGDGGTQAGLPSPGDQPQQPAASDDRHGRHAGNRPSYSSLTPPRSSEAEQNRHQPGNDHGHDNGEDHSM
jgi:hypothetical protein